MTDTMGRMHSDAQF
ncbi:hypothetical protein LI272_22080, partial [Bacteroides uniformis]|nr:hypothetical protein [Bacteroides uniformis]